MISNNAVGRPVTPAELVAWEAEYGTSDDIDATRIVRLIATLRESEAEVTRLDTERDANARAFVEADKARGRLWDRAARLEAALRERIESCDECEDGVIDSERSPSVYGADAYDGTGTAITDEFPCPNCGWIRAALAAGGAQEGKA